MKLFLREPLSGEPLLHPNFDGFINYAADKEVKTCISTNGTILTKHRRDKLIRSKLDTLIISIDGVDAETYKAVRQSNSFDKVVRHAEKFLVEKRRQGRGPNTVVQTICMKDNNDQAEEFYQH